MFAGSGLGEEGAEAVIPGSGALVRRHLAIRLDSWKSKWSRYYISAFFVRGVFDSYYFGARGKAVDT